MLWFIKFVLFIKLVFQCFAAALFFNLLFLWFPAKTKINIKDNKNFVVIGVYTINKKYIKNRDTL